MNSYPVTQARAKQNHGRFGGQIDNDDGSRYLLYVDHLSELWSVIDLAKDIMHQEQVWPDQCDYIISKLSPLKKIAINIAGSIKKRIGNPSGFNPYSLLVSAYYFTDQVDILLDYVREYREIVHQLSAGKSKQKLIASSLNGLESSLQDFMRELDKIAANSRLV